MQSVLNSNLKYLCELCDSNLTDYHWLCLSHYAELISPTLAEISWNENYGWMLVSWNICLSPCLSVALSVCLFPSTAHSSTAVFRLHTHRERDTGLGITDKIFKVMCSCNDDHVDLMNSVVHDSWTSEWILMQTYTNTYHTWETNGLHFQGCSSEVKVTQRRAYISDLAPCGAGAPSPFPLVHLLRHLFFYFSLSFIDFTYFLLLSIPSLSTRIVLLRFQAGGRRKWPNLGLVCCVCVICIP